MKKFNLLLLLLCTFYVAFSQKIGIDRLQTMGTPDWDQISDLALDADENYYLCGTFSGTLSFKGHTLKSNGGRDIFIAKLDKSDEVIWMKNFGGRGDDNSYSLLFDNDYIYLSGSFQQEISLTKEISLQTASFTDAFLTQLNTDGLIKWARSIKTKEPATKVYLQKSSDGQLLIAGTFSNQLQIEDKQLITKGKSDIYFASIKQDGALLKLSSWGDTGNETLYDFQADKNGHLYFAGKYTNTMMLNQVLNCQGESDGFYVKANLDGEIIQSHRFGGIYNDACKHLLLDNDNNVYLAGEFEYAIKIKDKEYRANKKQDVFLVKILENGNVEWGSTMDSKSFNSISSMELMNNERLYISGNFRGELHDVKSMKNSKDAYIANFNSKGELGWVTNAGSEVENNVYIKGLPSKELFISGYFSNEMIFQDFEVDYKNYKDLFFGRMVDCSVMEKVDLGEDQTSCAAIKLEADNGYLEYFWSTGKSFTNSIIVHESDTVSLKVVDNYGCSSIDTVIITIENNFELNIGNDTTLCLGDVLELEVDSGYISYLWEDNSTERKRIIDTTGIYWIKVENELGCAVDSLEAIFNPTPEFELGEPIDLSNQDTIILTAELPAGNYTYLWTTGDKTPTIVIGAYHVKERTVGLLVTNEFGCFFYDEIAINTGRNNKATEMSNQEQLPKYYKVFPNPSDGKFFITTSKPDLIRRVDVFDIRGNLVKTYQNGFSFPIEIDLSRKAKGVYLVRISEEKSSQDFNIILN